MPSPRRPRRGEGIGVSGGVPGLLKLPAAIGLGFLALPLLALTLRVPWSRLPELLTRPDAVEALRLSLLCAGAATLACLITGVPVAWVLARGSFPGATLLRALVTLPLVLPPVVGGVALLLAFGRLGLLGKHLDAWFGVTVPFTTLGVIVAETFVALPFLVISVEGALRAVDPGVEEAAATLGAGRTTVALRVTLPAIAPSVLAGAVLAWARALGEFGATITFAGNLPGRTQTLPLAVYLALQDDPDVAAALSLLLVGACVLALVLLRSRWLTRWTDGRSAGAL
ncbi:MAG: ABC transporter permease [Kineosporiaceae bacterium]